MSAVKGVLAQTASEHSCPVDECQNKCIIVVLWYIPVQWMSARMKSNSAMDRGQKAEQRLLKQTKNKHSK